MASYNPLHRKVLITTPEVVFHAPTQHTLDPRTIQQAIIIAEERFIRPAIGDDFYESLIEQKNVVVTSENMASLQTKINQGQPVGTVPVLVAGNLVNDLDGLNDVNKALWYQHLWKLTAECVLFVAFPDGFVQFASTGLVHSNPPANAMLTSQSNLTTPELRSVKWMMDKKLMDRIDPLLDAMHTWICKKGSYALYNKPCDCDSKGTPYKRKTDIILGLYDDEEGGCGCV
jgi:hypothetical protein